MQAPITDQKMLTTSLAFLWEHPRREPGKPIQAQYSKSFIGTFRVFLKGQGRQGTCLIRFPKTDENEDEA